MSEYAFRESSGSRPFIKGIEHFAIAAIDPSRLANWYIQHLNFDPLLEIEGTVYIKSANSVVLEFVKAKTVRPKPQILDAGLRHIAFSVDDLEKAQAKLRMCGVEFESNLIILPGMRLLFFRDAEGNFLHLIHREQALSSQPCTELTRPFSV
jgi:glyoxylase I family protein